MVIIIPEKAPVVFHRRFSAIFRGSGAPTRYRTGRAGNTALSPAGRFDVCSVVVGMAAEKYESEADLADELKLPDPYVAVRLNKLA